MTFCVGTGIPRAAGQFCCLFSLPNLHKRFTTALSKNPILKAQNSTQLCETLTNRRQKMNKTLNATLLVLTIVVLAGGIFLAGTQYARSNMMFGWGSTS